MLPATLSSAGWAQVRIHSPGPNVAQERVDLLFKMTCRVVAEEFRLNNSAEVEVPIDLVLGEAREGVVGDETSQIFTIYMTNWDEALFATSVSRIALQHLLSQDRKARIVGESLRRAQRAAPISADSLTRQDRVESLARSLSPPQYRSTVQSVACGRVGIWPSWSGDALLSSFTPLCAHALRLAP